jgi:diguanylate cyclase (GGDEF)-like protein/PAS domain S-box-containing protein
LGWWGWPQAGRTFELGGLILIAALLASLAGSQSSAANATVMAPSFVIEFGSLVLLGPHAMTILVCVGVIARRLGSSQGAHPYRLLLDVATVAIAAQAAGFIYLLLDGTMGGFVWPWQAVPIAAAVVVYCVVTSLSADVLVPLITRQPIDRLWDRNILRRCPNYFIGAALAAGLAELIDHRLWELLPVAAVPLYFAYQAYRGYLIGLEADVRRGEIIEALAQGVSVIDADGRVTVWNDALGTIVGCPCDLAIGRSLVGAVPVLGDTELPRAIKEAVASGSPRTLEHLGLPSSAGARTLQVRIIPAAGGVTLLWDDLTERTRTEQALKNSEDRFALMAEGANDALWEWQLRTNEFYFSGRWRAMVGLPAAASMGHPKEWLDRVHPDDAGPLKLALDAHLAGETEHFHHEHRVRHEDGVYRRFLCRGLAVKASGRRPTRIAGSMTDTTEWTIAQERIRSAGFLDPLTGLCNRAVFVEGLGRRLEEFKQRRGDGRFAVLYLDLDRFKVVNDSLGHLVGDELLTAVSRRLESCLRPGDTLARLGGDEFAILLNGLQDEQQANARAFKIQEALSAPVSVGGREVFTSASIGIAFGLSQYANPDDIMRDADTAMYHAKARGKARHELFDADMHARALDRLGLENDLRHAVARNDFEVHYQPIVSLKSGMCVGFESLVRWTRNGEAISPATFIPIAEELGLIEPIGTWVMDEACRTFAGWKTRFPASALDCITVNVSSRQLMQQNFLSIVEQAVHSSGLRPCDLRIEITETALMDSPNMAAEVLRELRDFGVKIYLDDFGTGYSSLSHLHKLPVDALKIDRSFVRSLLLPDRPAIVESILALARTLETSVVAEGIEDPTQAYELERLGCTHAQGYLFSRPLSVTAAEAMLSANQPLGPKREKVKEAKQEADVFYTSMPFAWPDHVPGSRPAVQDSTVRKGDLVELPGA